MAPGAKFRAPTDIMRLEAVAAPSKQIELRRGTLPLQDCLNVPTNEYRDVDFDSSDPIEFRVLYIVNFMHDFDRHASFTRQNLDVRFHAGDVLRFGHCVVHLGGSALAEARDGCGGQIAL
jgi:hypothetical protein